MTPTDVIPYFLLFYVIARLEWLNYKLGKIEGVLNKRKNDKS